MDLGFTISVDANLQEVDLLNLVLSNFNEAEKIKGCVKIMNNILKIEKNFDYDQEKVNTDEGWKFYKFEIDVFPVGKSSTEKQKLLLSSLCSLLQNQGLKFKAFSEFDE